jgi:hypothetical protein
MRAISSLSPPKASAFVFYSFAFEPVADAPQKRADVVFSFFDLPAARNRSRRAALSASTRRNKTPSLI